MEANVPGAAGRHSAACLRGVLAAFVVGLCISVYAVSVTFGPTSGTITFVADKAMLPTSRRLGEKWVPFTTSVKAYDAKPWPGNFADYVVVLTADKSGEKLLLPDMAKHPCVHQCGEWFGDGKPGPEKDCATAFFKHGKGEEFKDRKHNALESMNLLRMAMCKEKPAQCDGKCSVVINVYSHHLDTTELVALLRHPKTAPIIMELDPARIWCGIEQSKMDKDATTTFQCPAEAPPAFLNDHMHWFGTLRDELGRIKKSRLEVPSGHILSHYEADVKKVYEFCGQDPHVRTEPYPKKASGGL